MLKKILILLFFVGMLFPGIAQQENKQSKKEIRKARDKYLELGLGRAYLKVKDQATSPLMYKGPELSALKLDYLVHSDAGSDREVIKTLETEFGFGRLHSSTQSPWSNQRIESYRTSARYNQLYPVHRFPKSMITWYLGPEANLNGHFRVNYKYGNSALNFDFYLGLGIASRFEIPLHYKAKHFNIWFLKFKRRNRDLRLSWQLSSPLVGYIVRPTYVTVTNFIDPDLQTSINPGQTASGLFVPFNLRSQTELYYMLHNQNMFKLSYIWNFYSYNPGFNKVQSAMHGFVFSFVFKFNQKNQ